MLLKLHKAVPGDQNLHKVPDTWQLLLLHDDSELLNFTYELLKSPARRIAVLTVTLAPPLRPEQQASGGRE